MWPREAAETMCGRVDLTHTGKLFSSQKRATVCS